MERQNLSTKKKQKKKSLYFDLPLWEVYQQQTKLHLSKREGALGYSKKTKFDYKKKAKTKEKIT